MEIGKVPENVLKRAVFKQIRHRREEEINKKQALNKNV